MRIALAMALLAFRVSDLPCPRTKWERISVGKLFRDLPVVYIPHGVCIDMYLLSEGGYVNSWCRYWVDGKYILIEH